jgi:hypothetical protein
MTATRDALKHDLLTLIADLDAGDAELSDGSDVIRMIDALAPLSPIPDPNNHLAALAGRWTTLYASFGAGRSKGKSREDDSTLASQTFKAFPETPIRVKGRSPTKSPASPAKHGTRGGRIRLFAWRLKGSAARRRRRPHASLCRRALSRRLMRRFR